MKHLISLFCLFFPYFASAQSASSFDIMVGSHCSYRNIEGSTYTQTGFGRRSSEERSKLGWNFGLYYTVPVSGLLYLRTGLRVAEVGYKGKKLDEIRWPIEHDGRGGYTNDPSLVDKAEAVNALWFIETPVTVRAEIGKSSLCPVVEGGLSPQYLLAQNEFSRTDHGKMDFLKYPFPTVTHRFQIAATIGMGMMYKVGNRWAMLLQSNARYHFTNGSTHPEKEYLYNVGVEIGVRRRI